MAIPVLYWMLECPACGSRRVVHDSFLLLISTVDPQALLSTGEYGGPPLPERYTCAKGCPGPMKAIRSIFQPHDERMWLYAPHVPVKMTAAQKLEWRQLIETAGVARRDTDSSPPQE